jgi:polysaccharide biosynthesis protein PslJ
LRVLAGEGQRSTAAALIAVTGVFALLTVSVVASPSRKIVVLLVGAALVALAVPAYRRLFAWRSLIVSVILIIFVIPIRRYALPGSLPFDLEPYRLLVALIAAGWLASLLVDPRVRWRRSGFEGPLGLLVIAILGSFAMNAGRVSNLSPIVSKRVIFFASFLIVFYLIVSTVTRVADVDFLSRVLVASAAGVGLCTVIEARTGINVFNHLSSVFPFLRPLPFIVEGAATDNRGAGIRAYGSSQHPIAMSAVFIMLLPLAFALARTHGKRWVLVCLLLLLGAVSTLSRTGISMLVMELGILLWLRRRYVVRLWPAIIPAVVVIHLAIPGSLGTIFQSFFPSGGLVAQQTNTRVGSGRLATLMPALRHELYPDPVLGEGFGTRVTTRFEVVPQNAPITDNQWLSTLLEIGIVGAGAIAWLFLRFVRRLGRAAKDDESPEGWLMAGFAAGVAGYAFGMLTYDAFSFIQVTLIMFIVLGLGAALMRAVEAAPPRLGRYS